MPSPKIISRNEKEWLKKYIQEAYDISVVDTFDCKVLSDLIEKKNGIKISYSTFRRLFNLVPNSNSQSRYVLNCLAISVGFKNWELFSHHVSSFDTHVINQNIQLYSIQLPNSDSILLETIKNLPISTWNGGYQLQNIITLLIEQNDFDILKEVVQIPFDIENADVYEHLVIGLQSLYFQSIKNNEAVIEFVSSNIGNSVLLQKCLLQAYVDEKYLNSFLGKWFDAIEENKIPDLLLFKSLLLCQKAFNKNEIENAKTFLNFALNQCKQNQIEVHPILKARIGIWNLILYSDNEKLETYFSSLLNPFEKADFAVIASRLLWTYYDEDVTIPFLELISINEFPLVKDFFQKGRHNVLILTLAIYYHLKKDYQKSEEFFKTFNQITLGYDIVNIEFYLPWVERLNKLTK